MTTDRRTHPSSTTNQLKTLQLTKPYTAETSWSQLVSITYVDLFASYQQRSKEPTNVTITKGALFWPYVRKCRKKQSNTEQLIYESLYCTLCVQTVCMNDKGQLTKMLIARLFPAINLIVSCNELDCFLQLTWLFPATFLSIIKSNKLNYSCCTLLLSLWIKLSLLPTLIEGLRVYCSSCKGMRSHINCSSYAITRNFKKKSLGPPVYMRVGIFTA